MNVTYSSCMTLLNHRRANSDNSVYKFWHLICICNRCFNNFSWFFCETICSDPNILLRVLCCYSMFYKCYVAQTLFDDGAQLYYQPRGYFIFSCYTRTYYSSITIGKILELYYWLLFLCLLILLNLVVNVYSSACYNHNYYGIILLFLVKLCSIVLLAIVMFFKAT
jgi:hypothetical protein